MNYIAQMRNSRGMTQSEFVFLLNIPYMDVSLLSKIENDYIRPNPADLKRMAKVLKCDTRDFYHDAQLGLPEILDEQPDLLEPDAEVLELMNTLKYGHNNAITRHELMLLMDCNERKLRKIVEKAQKSGYLVGNTQDGRGYFIIESYEDGKRYYRQERNRAVHKLVCLSPLLKWLKEWERGFNG